MAVAFLLDENVDVAYRAQLIIRGSQSIRVVCEPDAPLKRTTDSEILTWCERNDFVLITNNRRTMPRHLADHLAAGRHVPGIVMLDDDLGIGGNMDELLLIAGASYPEELRDRITYLPIRQALHGNVQHAEGDRDQHLHAGSQLLPEGIGSHSLMQ